MKQKFLFQYQFRGKRYSATFEVIKPAYEFQYDVQLSFSPPSDIPVTYTLRFNRKGDVVSIPPPHPDNQHLIQAIKEALLEYLDSHGIES